MDDPWLMPKMVVILIILYETGKHMKNWIKEHFDTLIVIGSVIAATWAIKNDMHDIDRNIHDMDLRLTTQIFGIDKRVTTIETIMIMQGAPIKSFSAKNDLDEKNKS
jgi:hypothetical protein